MTSPVSVVDVDEQTDEEELAQREQPCTVTYPPYRDEDMCGRPAVGEDLWTCGNGHSGASPHCARHIGFGGSVVGFSCRWCDADAWLVTFRFYGSKP